MAQQTAVDYLIEQLQAPCRGIPSHIIEKAKAMEKEQIVNAWDKRVFRGTFVKGWHIETQNGEEYYNETYTQGSE